MKKIPRDIGAAALIKLLDKAYGYKTTRQTGSHIRLTTEFPTSIILQYPIIAQLN